MPWKLLNRRSTVSSDGGRWITRIKEVAALLDCIRLGFDTPCTRTGFCDDADCRIPARVYSQITIIESNKVKDRLMVVFVGEELGY